MFLVMLLLSPMAVANLSPSAAPKMIDFDDTHIRIPIFWCFVALKFVQFQLASLFIMNYVASLFVCLLLCAMPFTAFCLRMFCR